MRTKHHGTMAHVAFNESHMLKPILQAINNTAK